jgi:hypothetical protein
MRTEPHCVCQSNGKSQQRPGCTTPKIVLVHLSKHEQALNDDIVRLCEVMGRI